MIINNIEFRNFKSYGNKLQSISFDNKGKLILLTGTNGAGKSSIGEVIDLCLFNQVRGKESSKIPLKYFPNRLNKELYTSINFTNNNNDLIEVERRIQPNSFLITKNNEPYTERYKLMTDTEREKIIGFNYNTFKSFISLSMNDFRNFIKLSSEDKRNLLDRLFNLEEIDSYHSINKELIYQNKKEIEKLSLEILNINKTVKEFTSILKDKKNSVNKESRDELKNRILIERDTLKSKKELLLKNENDISNLLIKIQEKRNLVNITENENIKRRTELTEINEKIKLYESGSCPYCNSDLNDDIHINLIDVLNGKKSSLKDLISRNDIETNNNRGDIYLYVSQQRVLDGYKDTLLEEINNTKIILYSLKDKYDNYNDSDDDIIKEIKEKGSILLKEKKIIEDRIQDIILDNESLNDLKNVLSENGVRKKIISSLVPPINKTLSTLLDKINYPYRVILDDNFDAIIYDKGDIIYSEIMSNGEIKMLNLCIAISYISMIRKMNNINLLFMDEVFQSIHKENINLILELLKSFSKEEKINLILVHHGLEEVDPKIFDSIISVEKDMFSDIKINNNL